MQRLCPKNNSRFVYKNICDTSKSHFALFQKKYLVVIPQNRPSHELRINNSLKKSVEVFEVESVLQALWVQENKRHLISINNLQLVL